MLDHKNKQLKEILTEINHQAYHDVLTGLPNRKLGEEKHEKNYNIFCRVIDVGIDTLWTYNAYTSYVIGREFAAALFDNGKSFRSDNIIHRC
jgi:GGDEF domain-containing protein